MVNSKIQAAEENLIHVYNRFPIALDHGEGMYLYDTEGKEYLDFAAGFAVSGLGYDNKELNQALKDQFDKGYHARYFSSVTATATTFSAEKQFLSITLDRDSSTLLC